MADILKDFVPAGEDPGASGEGGFRDFVPTPKPTPQTVEEEEVKKPNIKQTTKSRKVFKK